MKYIRTNWDIPFYNMALEEYVMECFPGDEDYLFFYIHSPSVIVGRHQNTIEEVNQEYIEANHIYVARRLSGGGAVYHDKGNLNYSIITKKQIDAPYDFSEFSRPVLKALRELGVEGEQSGRNDLTIDGKKFSGAAQHSAYNRLLHHGTLLFDADLSHLAKALQVKPMKIESKGIKSVQSRVTNISSYLESEIDIEAFKQVVLKNLMDDQNAQEYEFTWQDIKMIEKKVNEKFSTWAWNYGESPGCSIQKSKKFGCGIIDIRLDINQGLIRDLRMYGDFFALKSIEDFVKTFIGSEYSRQAFKSVLDRVKVGEYINGLTNVELESLLFDS